jgi:glycosyltransferase involved in cell wall biosynthesis
MRVLLSHVHYRQAGGEDAVFATEVGILRDAGVHVDTLELRSADLGAIPLWQRLRMARGYPDHAWGRTTIAAAIERHLPDVVHFHNIFPQLGPGAISEAHRRGCATVQTLHNYRLSCLAGTHLRNEEICELCTPGHYAFGVRYACYRGSRLQSVLTRRATARQWRAFVDGHTPLYWLALTAFMRDYFIAHGAPEERIVLKANSADAGHPGPIESRAGVFCGGRLSPEKGIVPLMRTWPDQAPILSVAGAGPLEREVRACTRENVRYLGPLTHEEMLSALRRALVVAMPSVWPEPLPLVTLEAFAEGTPVVAFEGWSLGSVVKELSRDCVVRFHDFPGLAQRAIELTNNPIWPQLSRRCVDLWRTEYSPKVNRDALLSTYEAAIAARRALPA